MKLMRYTKFSVTALFLSLTLNACAGIDASEDPAASSNANNAANAEDVGFNENSNNGSNENLSNNSANNSNGNLNNENLGNNNLANDNDLLDDGAGGGKANEFVNNASGENFVVEGNNKAEQPANLAAELNSTQDLGLETNSAIVGGTQDTGATAIAPPDTNMGATDTSLAPRGASAAPTGGTVRYIVRNGTSSYDKPNGSVVKSYEQGDHPLVTADGEWVRTSDGYVPSTAVTPRPVPRAKSAKSWR